MNLESKKEKAAESQLNPEDLQLVRRAKQWNKEGLSRYLVTFAWSQEQRDIMVDNAFLEAPDNETAYDYADLLVRCEIANSGIVIDGEDGHDRVPDAEIIHETCGVAYHFFLTPVPVLLREAAMAPEARAADKKRKEEELLEELISLGGAR